MDSRTCLVDRSFGSVCALVLPTFISFFVRLADLCTKKVRRVIQYFKSHNFYKNVSFEFRKRAKGLTITSVMLLCLGFSSFSIAGSTFYSVRYGNPALVAWTPEEACARYRDFVESIDSRTFKRYEYISGDNNRYVCAIAFGRRPDWRYCSVPSSRCDQNGYRYLGGYWGYIRSYDCDTHGRYVKEFCTLGPSGKVRKTKKSQGKPLCPVGNPIDIASGNKYQSEPVFSTGIKLSLNYNSSTGMWRHSQAYALDITDTEILLIRPDGKGLTFTQQGSQWKSDGDVFYALNEYDDGAGSAWKVVTPSGNTELYDAEGHIIKRITLQGEHTAYSYTGGLVTVAGSQGESLVLEENSDGNLQCATLNGEVTATFEYDDQQRLIARVSPDGNRTQYHYENTDFPKHLTGITGPDGQRFATWAYDSEGRGILSEHAGQERAELVFNADGSTTVTNALGKQTTYHFTEIEGLKRVTRVEGHATEHCVGANKAYSYYDSGLLKTKTDWGGNTTRYEYNPRGLITRIVEADSTTQARTVEQSWHPSLPLLEQRTDGTQSTRFNYDTQHRLLQTEVQRQTP